MTDRRFRGVSSFVLVWKRELRFTNTLLRWSAVDKNNMLNIETKSDKGLL